MVLIKLSKPIDHQYYQPKMRILVHFRNIWRSRLRLPLISVSAVVILVFLLSRNYTTLDDVTNPGPNLLHHYWVDEHSDKETVDFFLNVRKLSLWAVRELNLRVKERYPNGTRFWWTDPTKTVDVRSAPYEDGFLHEVVFLAHPGHVPFSVRIIQTKVTTPESEEMRIVGDFTRLASQGGLADVAEEPPAELHQTHDEYFKEDNLVDPELTTWHRENSFMVPDYVDFRADRSRLYPISPGGREKEAHEIYCGDALQMLIMISSAPSHFENRRTIRETYGSESNLRPQRVRVVFLFGRVTNETLQSKLEEEAEQHEDIIQAEFTDSYHNLTLSHLLMYNWVQTTCEGIGLPKWVYKADDDFFLNVELALRIAAGNPQYEFIGCLYCGTRPVRSVSYITKYYTPHYMYLPETYVGYLSGVAYLLRTDVIPLMLKMSLTTPMIHMDDAYMTGLLPRQLGITPMSSRLIAYGRTEPDPCMTKTMANSAAESVEDIRRQYEEWVKPAPKNCSKALDRVTSLIPIIPLREQYKIGCLFS